MLSSSIDGDSLVETQVQTWAKYFADQKQSLQLHLNALEIQESRIRLLGLLDKSVDYLELWGIKNGLQEAK